MLWNCFIADKGDIVDAMKSGFLRCDDDMRQGMFTTEFEGL